MRIEINAGGLGGISVSQHLSELNSLLTKSENVIDSFNNVKTATCHMNGGVGNLQTALDYIQNRIASETDKYNNLKLTFEKTQDFIDTAVAVDNRVSQLVTKNQVEFYMVNAWADPHMSFRIDILFHEAEYWLDRGLDWLIENIAKAPKSPAGMLAFLTMAGIKEVSNIGSGETTLPNGVTMGYSGPKNEYEDGTYSGSVLSSFIESNKNIGGLDVKDRVEGEILGYSAETSYGFKSDDDQIMAYAGAKGEGHLAKVKHTTTVGEYYKGSEEVSVGNIEGEGYVGFTFIEDGKIRPHVGGKAEVQVSAVKGQIERQLGTDDYNLHTNAEGSLLGASAELEAQIGVIKYKDPKTHKEVVGYGAKAEAGAEAYLAEGRVEGGITIAGIKINVGLEGKAGGAGAKAGGAIMTDKVSGEIDLGLGLGAGLDFDIDFSGFKNPFENVKAEDFMFWKNWF